MQRFIHSIATTVRHMGMWLTSSSGDLVYPNPNFVPPASGNDEDKSSQSKKGVAVYCVHGTADFASAFSLVAERSIGKMPEAISGFNLVSFEGRGTGLGIDDFARQLAEKIIANGDNDVVLAGHSRGGLVSAYLAEYLAQEYGIRVRAVIAVGAPFAGSSKATFPFTWLSKSVEQMQPGSEFLRELKVKMQHSTCKYYCFAAKHDFFVDIDSAHVNEADLLNTLETPHGHLSMLSSHELVRRFNECLHWVTTDEDCQEEEDLAEGLEKEEIEMTAFTVIAIPSALEFACEQINDEIKKLKQRYHLWSPEAKISVLNDLHARLSAMTEGQRNKDYPEAQTIGEYISAFMQDETNAQGMKPADVLSTPLNGIGGYTLTSFIGGGYVPQSDAFIKGLIESLSDDLLPKPEEKVLSPRLS